MKLALILLSNRADRIAALGRLAIASFSTAAALIDAPLPQATADAVVVILIGYLALAAGFALWFWLRPLDRAPLGWGLHAIDLLVVAALVYLTDGVSTPFFALYIFAILSATLKWNARGALWTTGIVTVLFVPTGFIGMVTSQSGSIDLLRYTVRLVQVCVVGGMLTMIGAQRERIWNELFRLSRPIDRGSGGLADCASRCAGHVRDFFDAPRAIIFWNHHEEPGWHAVEADAGGIRPLPLPRHAEAPIADAAPGTILRLTAGMLGSVIPEDGIAGAAAPQAAFDPARALDWRIESGLAATIGSDTLSAWLVLPDFGDSADAPLLRALTPQLVGAFAEASAAWAWQAAQADGARLQMARHLHDGVLQFFAGLALQLKVMGRHTDRPDAIARRIAALEMALRAEQAELRLFVDGAGQIAPYAGVGLSRLLARLVSQWDIAIDASDCADPPPALATDIGQIAREAVANAVRHGGATALTVRAAIVGQSYRLTILDNGRGMLRHGSFDARAMHTDGSGPRSILARVDTLGGDVRIESGPSGVRLDVVLPIVEVLAA